MPPAITLSPIHLDLLAPGAIRFFSILLKSWISVQAAVLLVTTTPLPELLMALRWLHVPRLLVAITALMWRYLVVLVDEAKCLLTSRNARSPSLPGSGGSLFWRGLVTGGMAGSLLLRSIERSERVFSAMQARGYDGEIRSLPRPALSRKQIIFLWLALLGLAVLLVIGTLVMGRAV